MATSLPAPGSWHHIAGTYDGSVLAIYVDGQLAAQQSASGPIAITTDPLNIASKPSGTIFTRFNGNIDDVRIYGSALPADQIAQLYQTDTVGDGLPNWWRQYYFGVSSSTDTTTCATCDYDGTGQNNLFKYLAGLDPTNRTSVFQIISFSPQGNDVSIVWQAGGGRTNFVQTANSMVGSSNFSDTSPAFILPGSGDVFTNWVDTGGATNWPNRFYRIRLGP